MSASPQKPRSPAFVDAFGELGPEVRRVAVFGPQNSGKTTYYASLYGRATGDGVVVEFDQGPTSDYLSELWDEYTTGTGGFPTATGKATPANLVLTLSEKALGRGWRLAAIEYAGELIEKAKGGDTLGFLRDQVELWLMESEAILVFLDVFEGRPEEAQQRRDEVMKLLHLCREAGGGTIRRPLGLVLTKWDILGPIGADYEAEEARARQLVERDGWFRQIHEYLGTYGGNYRIFPVSAVGPDRVPFRHPSNPYNLFRPLLWAAEEADARRLAEARAQASPLKPSAAAEVFESLLRDGRIDAGPTFEAARGRIADLRARGRRVGFRLAAGIAAATGLALGAGWWVFSRAAGREFDNVASFRRTYTGPDAVDARIAKVRGLLGRYSVPLGGPRLGQAQRWQAEDLQAKRVFDADRAARLARLEREAAWQGLVVGAKDAKTIEQCQRVVETADAFKAKYGPGEQAFELATLRVMTEGRRIVLVQERAAFDFAIADANRDSVENKLDQAIANLKSYLARVPQPADEYLATCRATLESLETRSDDNVFLELNREVDKARRSTSASMFLAADQRIREYLTAGGRRKELGRKLAEELALAWDRRLYGDLKQAASIFAAELDKKSLGHAHEASIAYLDISRGLPRRQMTEAAGRWKQWADAVMDGKTYALSLESVFVPKGSFLEDGFWISRQFSVHLDGPRFTKIKGGYNHGGSRDPENDGVIGSFDNVAADKRRFSIPYRPGDEGLKLIALRDGNLGPWEVSLLIKPESFVPGVLCRGIDIMDKYGKQIRVKFSCPDVVPPALPEYPR